MLIVGAVVEPTWLGSVSIRKGRRERGACVVFVGWRPFALVVFFVVIPVSCVLGSSYAVFACFTVVVVLKNEICQ
jgi:hypothetical protein